MEATIQKSPSRYNFLAIDSIVERIECHRSFGLSTGWFNTSCPKTPLTCYYSALSRKKESRKRNLSFHLPAAISCSPSVRLLQTDSSYVTLGDMYDEHCQATGISKEEPILFAGEKVKTVLRGFRPPSPRQVFRKLSVYPSPLTLL